MAHGDPPFANSCPIRERTADGDSVGRCWFKLERKVCPRHGDVSTEVALYLEGKGLSEDPRIEVE